MTTPRLSISLPIYSAAMDQLASLAKLADEAKFETTWTYEFYRTPNITLASVAPHTRDIKLGSGIVTAFARSPMVTANEAADVDELSGGRAIAGIGPGGNLGAWHNSDVKNVIPRMREYIAVMRTAWGAMGSGAPASFQGDYYNVHLQGLKRPLVRVDIPIYLSATRPKMLQLAGEVADGLHGYFFTPEYLNEVVRPNLQIGAERSGRDLKDFDLCNWFICGVHEDRSEAMRRARIQTGYYAAGSPHLCKFAGLEKEWQQLVDGLASKGFAAFEDTDDKLVEAFSIAGTPDEVRGQLERYNGMFDSVAFHTPYIHPLTPEEGEDSFRRIVETFGGFKSAGL